MVLGHLSLSFIFAFLSIHKKSPKRTLGQIKFQLLEKSLLYSIEINKYIQFSNFYFISQLYVMKFYPLSQRKNNNCLEV